MLWSSLLNILVLLRLAWTLLFYAFLPFFGLDLLLFYIVWRVIQTILSMLLVVAVESCRALLRFIQHVLRSFSGRALTILSMQLQCMQGVALSSAGRLAHQSQQKFVSGASTIPHPVSIKMIVAVAGVLPKLFRSGLFGSLATSWLVGPLVRGSLSPSVSFVIWDMLCSEVWWLQPSASRTARCWKLSESEDNFLTLNQGLMGNNRIDIEFKHIQTSWFYQRGWCSSLVPFFLAQAKSASLKGGAWRRDWSWQVMQASPSCSLWAGSVVLWSAWVWSCHSRWPFLSQGHFERRSLGCPFWCS